MSMSLTNPEKVGNPNLSLNLRILSDLRKTFQQKQVCRSSLPEMKAGSLLHETHTHTKTNSSIIKGKGTYQLCLLRAGKLWWYLLAI